MSESCEFLDHCGFFINFRGNVEVVKNGWIRMYCSDIEKSDKCERKKIRKSTGSSPPDNMSPTGVLCASTGETPE
jgi:hypothetical protein